MEGGGAGRYQPHSCGKFTGYSGCSNVTIKLCGEFREECDSSVRGPARQHEVRMMVKDTPHVFSR
jgi:hypothetical protein